MSAAPTLRRADLFRYSMLAIPAAFAGFPLYVLAPDFFATQHGLSLTLMGMLLLGLRLFDAVQDPWIGALSDRFRHQTGLIMCFSALVLCSAFYALFNMLYGSPALWFSLTMALAVTAYSILTINLAALGSLWGGGAQTQLRIAAAREACGLIGLLLAVSLPGLLAAWVPASSANAYFGFILFALMGAAWLVFHPWLVRLLQHDTPRIASNFSVSAALAATPRPTRVFLLIYGLSMLASSIPAVLVIFFVRDLLQAEAMMGLFLLLYFLSGAAAMPLWRFASARLGHYRAWVLSMLLAVASFVWAFFLSSGDSWQYAMICLFSGMALGADLALPPAILAGHMQAHGTAGHASTHYALLALVAKLSLAVASAIALPLLGQAGFVPAAENSDAALFALSCAYALIPCILKLASAFWLYRRFIIPTKGDSRETHTHRTDWGSHHA